MDTPVRKQIPVSALTVDTKVQRSQFDQKRVEKIVANFNEAALGVVTVSERDDGSLKIVDGWHRWEAVRRVTDNQGELDCEVFSGLTLAEEAQLFLDKNYTNAPKILDKFRVRVTKGETFATEIADILRSYHWEIASTIGNGNVNAVGALEKIHALSKVKESDPPLLQLVFLTINNAWGQDRYGGQAHIIVGLGSLFAEHGSLIDVSRLVNVLKHWKGGPEGLVTNAKASAALHGMKVGYAVANLITEKYNVGLRAKSLPNWRIRK
jgi:hypothetical protein